MSSIEQNQQNKQCKIEGCKGLGKKDGRCGKRYLHRGYCYKHYKRLMKGIDPAVPTGFEPRPAIIDGNIAKIPLGINAKDGYAIVDREYAYISNYKWIKRPDGYAESRIKGKLTLMHHIINGKPIDKLVTDHINRDKLDNRKSNLRMVTSSANLINKGVRKSNKSGHKNIAWIEKVSLWEVRISRNYKPLYRGRFKTLEGALKARNNFIKELGEVIY